MAWDEIVTEPKRVAMPTATLKYLRPKGRGKNAGPKVGARHELTIVLPTTICGVAKSKAFRLVVGSGAEKGKVRVLGCGPETRGAITAKEMAHCWSFRFGHVPKLADETFDERKVCRRISDEVFEIDADNLFT